MSRTYSILLVTAALLALGMVMRAQAQGTQNVQDMIPFTDTTYAISGLVPKGWQHAGPGLYARKASATDPTLLVQQAAAMSAEQLRTLVGGQLGLKSFPASDVTQKTEHLTWSLYSVPQFSASGATLAAEVAIAEANGKTFVVMLLAAPDEVQTLRESVFLPAVKALAPLSGSAATAAATEELASDEHEVTFTSGNDTIYGTLLLPNGSRKMPAALLLSGSGPTDRDGNNTLLPSPIDSHKIMARILADQGVASLRYDKLGTGKTGIASYAAHPGDLDFDTYVNEARDGLKYLKSRPDIDPTRIMILGHSEGGFIAMLVASDSGSRVKALALVNSLSKPYLQTIHDQYQARLADAVKAGTLTQAGADKIVSAIDNINRSLLSTGTLPADIPPELAQIYNPTTAKFLASVGKYDPGKVAESLPNTLAVLVTCGEKDIQVLCSDVPNLLDGFRLAGNEHVTFVQLKDTNHILREVQGGDPADYADTSKPFSTQMKQALSDFVKASLLR
jgi:uncharacterized protein